MAHITPELVDWNITLHVNLKQITVWERGFNRVISNFKKIIC